MYLPNDYTRCNGSDCVKRQSCARHTAPINDNVVYSWVLGPDEGDGTDCLYYIYDADTTT